MRIKTLVTFRSKSVHLEEMAVVSSQIPAPETIWDPSVMTEEKIQALVEHGLLRPKAEVEWKAPTGEAFPTEDDKEQVVFASFFEHGFNVPAGDCFRGLFILLQARAGTPCSQLHHCSVFVHPPL
jgi:hypothetical protein